MVNIKVYFENCYQELTPGKIKKKLLSQDNSFTTIDFLENNRDVLPIKLKKWIQELYQEQDSYREAMKFENKVYFDQLDRTSDDPEIK